MSKPSEVNELAVSYSSTDDKEMLKFIKQVKMGITIKTFVGWIKNTPFEMEDWSNILNVNIRTLQRYRKENKKFSTMLSERILEVALLYNYGKEVFGSREKFDIWLETENLALGNKEPKSFLDTGFGIAMVKDELIRIEHGVLA